MRTAALGIAILFGMVALGRAAPLDPRAVDGGATWVAHLDVDAMRESLVVRNAYTEFVEKCPVAQAASPLLDASRAMLGLDPRQDLQGVTLYGRQLGKEEGVLIVYAKVNQELLEEKVKRAQGYESSSHGSHTLHTWSYRDPRGERRMTGAFYKDQCVVFSGSKGDVEAALDVLDGKSSGLTHRVLAAKVPAGTLFLFRAVGIAGIRGVPNSMKKIESAALAVGENEGRSFLELHVEANSHQAAEQLGKIAEGLRAAAALEASGDAQVRDLSAGMKILVADKTLSVENQAPAELVWRHVQRGIEKIVEHFRKLRELRQGGL